MSIDILSRDLLQKAEAEKETIETELSKELKILKENSNQNIASFKEKLKAKYEEDISNQKEKILGSFKRESKKEILEVKTKLIEEVYFETYEELCLLKTEEKSKFLKNIINSVKKNGFKFDKIICSKKDSKLVKEICDTNIKLQLEEEMNGLVFSSNSGKEILDMTFKTLLKEAFEKTEGKIQKTLFNI